MWTSEAQFSHLSVGGQAHMVLCLASDIWRPTTAFPPLCAPALAHPQGQDVGGSYQEADGAEDIDDATAPRQIQFKNIPALGNQPAKCGTVWGGMGWGSWQSVDWVGGGTPALQYEGSVDHRPSLLPTALQIAPHILAALQFVLKCERGVNRRPSSLLLPLDTPSSSPHTSHPTHSQPVVFVLQYERGVDVDQRVQNKHTADRQLKLVVLLADGCIHEKCEGWSSE